MDGDQGDPARGRVQQRVDLPGEGGRGGPIADAVTCDGPGSESRAERLTSALSPGACHYHQWLVPSGHAKS